MNTVNIEKKQVQMIAHRGLSGLEPENSIPAFVAAGNRRYYGIETDIHVTRDKKLIVIHDDNTQRVSGVSMDVEDSDYEELRVVVLKDLCKLERECGIEKSDVLERNDLLIPNLKEYIQICKKYEKTCILELKNLFSPEDIPMVIEEIQSLGYLEHVVFISFVLENLIELRKLLPKQPMQYLVYEYDQSVLDALNQFQLELDIRYTGLTKEIVDEVHANGHLVNCWTVDKKEAAEQLVAYGVDFITTNYLE